MKIIATISDMRRVAVVLDLVSGAVRYIPALPEFKDANVLGRAPCRPFGISWTSNQLFIANNRQIIAFDTQLAYCHKLTTALQINTHQLGYRDGLVWAVSPWTNSLIGIPIGTDRRSIEFDLLEQELRDYYPRYASEAEDRHHFNSLLWTDTQLFVGAHAFGNEGFIYGFDAANMRPQSVLRNVGASIHNLAFCDGELFWIDTGGGAIRSDRRLRQPLCRQGYARGLAVTGGHFIVAISDHLTREARNTRGAWIQLIDRHEGNLVAEWRLENTGSVNDLRLLDAFDYAHWLAPFWGGT